MTFLSTFFTSSANIQRALWGVALVATALGFVFALLPTSAESVIPQRPQFGEIAPPPAVATTSVAAEDIVLANAFSVSRTPPDERYLPPESDEAMAGGAMMSAGSVEPPMDEVFLTGDVPRLYGTVVQPDGARALLRLDPERESPQLYRVGDRGGPFRVVSITPRRVVLSGPQGRVTLTLDPNEVRP